MGYEMKHKLEDKPRKLNQEGYIQRQMNKESVE